MSPRTPPDWLLFTLVIGTGLVVAMIASHWLRQVSP